MSSPAVSVLIPAFNAEPYVDDAIRSVLEQTLAAWEIIAIDDCSSDGTFARLEAWKERDPRIRIYRNPTNRGMTENWNACLQEARGEHVVKLDADDVFRPRTLDILHSALQQKNRVAAAVRTLLCDERLEPMGAPPSDAALMKGGIDPYSDQDLPAARWMEIAVLGQQPWHSSALMVPRQWLATTGGFDARFGCMSDTELILRTLRRDGIVAHSSYVGCYYRQTPGSVNATYRRKGWLLWEEVALFLLNFDTLAPARLGRAARDYRVYLWRRWKRRHTSGESFQELPEAFRANVEQILSGVRPPPMRDRVRVLARRASDRL